MCASHAASEVQVNVYGRFQSRAASIVANINSERGGRAGIAAADITRRGGNEGRGAGGDTCAVRMQACMHARFLASRTAWRSTHKEVLRQNSGRVQARKHATVLASHERPGEIHKRRFFARTRDWQRARRLHCLPSVQANGMRWRTPTAQACAGRCTRRNSKSTNVQASHQQL